MEVKITRVTDWRRVINAARWTVGKRPIDHEPSDEFKEKMCLSEHSPLRLLEFDIQLIGVQSFVVGHLTRHFIGVIPFVSTSRPDRNGTIVPRKEQRKTDPVNMQLSINAQALINISRKRLCFLAEATTRAWWSLVIQKLAEIDPTLAKHCVPDCKYKNRCTEFQSCGWWEKNKNI